MSTRAHRPSNHWRLSSISRALLEDLLSLLCLQLNESLALHLSFFFAPRRLGRGRGFAFKFELKRLLLGKEFCRSLIAGRLLLLLALGLGLLR
jgi:hypothetical protein